MESEILDTIYWTYWMADFQISKQKKFNAGLDQIQILHCLMQLLLKTKVLLSTHVFYMWLSKLSKAVVVVIIW